MFREHAVNGLFNLSNYFITFGIQKNLFMYFPIVLFLPIFGAQVELVQ